MRSAAGWYIGELYNEDGFIMPYARLTTYMSKEDAIAFLEIEQPVEVIEDRALHS